MKNYLILKILQKGNQLNIRNKFSKRKKNLKIKRHYIYNRLNICNNL